jgi:hypothetical protein
VGRLPDDDPVGGGDAFQTCGGVDHVADHTLGLAHRVEADQRLTGRDANPHRQLQGRVGIVELADRHKHAQTAADRPLRVVLVDDRGTEDGHHPVADEFVEGAPEALDLGPQPHVVGA